MIFYIKGQHLRNFGFPRLKEDNITPVQAKGKLKRFLWKKTNFVTDLPKHAPVARYLVAHTSTKSLSNQPLFYMHVSVLRDGKPLTI